MKEIIVFSAGRSDLGILKNLIKKIEFDKKINLNLVFGPAHSLKLFGLTKYEISEIKIKKKIYIKFNNSNSNQASILKSISKIIDKSSSFLLKNKFDSAIILGDRYEAFAFALCCFNFNIPITHLGGGSITLGSLDNVYRKSISQMAHLHFVETSMHKKNLLKMNIKKNVFISGAPALENISKSKNRLHQKIMNKELLNFLSSKKKKILACFHPETNIPKKDNVNNLIKLINFLNKIDQKILFTYPNADEGYHDYIKIIKKKFKTKDNILIKNLGIQKYHYMLSKSDILIGNSSSGIIESCSFKIACINLGNRQKKRLSPKNIIHSSFNIIDIKKAYDKAMSRNFKIKLKNFKNPYEVKNSSDKIFNIIKKNLIEKKINKIEKPK